ncbi:MAG: glycosyltransferase family 39 protein [Planctomycetes bacterium]|nr:glycosyltransferase family 39 protein [Planctomycetota bacterium]
MPSPSDAPFVLRAAPLGILAGAAFVLLALFVRALLLLFVPSVPYTDAIYFDFESARSFAAGDFLGGFRHWVPPLYPLLVSVPYRLLGDMEQAVHVVGVLLGALTVLPAAGIAHAFAGRGAGWIAALFLALHPYHARISVYGSSHAPYVLFLAIALYLALRLLAEPSVRRAAQFAAAAAAAYWIRQEATALVLFACAAIVAPCAVLLLRGRPAPALRSRVGTACVALVVFGLLISPIAYGTYVETGRWVLSSKGGVSLLGHGRELNRLAEDRVHTLWETQIETMADYKPLSMLALFREDPAGTAAAWALQFGALLAHAPEAFAYLLFPLACIALLRRRLAGRRLRTEGYAAAFALFNIALLACFYDSKRLLASMIPLFAAWSAIGLLESCEWIGGARGAAADDGDAPVAGRRARRAGVICALLLVPFLAHLPARWGYYIGASREEIAGDWLRWEQGAGRRIMDLDGCIAHYAAGKAIVFPVAEPDDVLFYARARGVEFITGSAAGLQKTRRTVWEALAEGRLPGVEKLHAIEWSEEDGRRRGLGADTTVIYRVR